MSHSPRVVLTGSEGYVGSVLAPILLREGFDVLGIDTGYFADCWFQPPASIPTLRADVRDLSEEVLVGADAIVHLAALSNDALGRLAPGVTHEINAEATARLAGMARSAGVRRFVFAASCIVYGVAGRDAVAENASTDPQTEYARSKLEAEQSLCELADDRFSPVVLRNGTVYGSSPRIRLDTVFNDLIASGVAFGRVVVQGDGTESRPVVDVRDVAWALVAALSAPADVVHGQVINVGSAHLNQRIGELAELAAALTGADLEVRGMPNPDQRDYVVDFERCARIFPRLYFMSTAQGGRDLVRQLRANGFDSAAYERRRFVRLDRLRALIDDNRLDHSLRWRQPVEAA